MLPTNYDPNNCASHNDHFAGLPFTETNARVVLLPVSWDATASYKSGTAEAFPTILKASYQLDLQDNDISNAWKLGIYMDSPDAEIAKLNKETQQLAKKHIEHLEHNTAKFDTRLIKTVNENCRHLKNWVYDQTKALLDRSKLVGLVGGEHSVALGYLKAISERYKSFGILQIDAHCDLRPAYQDFVYSHASIFYNAMEEINNAEKLVQVGVRDYCQDETNYIVKNAGRVHTFYDQAIQEALFQGKTYHQICQNIVELLPPFVYISFDIDGLDPKLCPNTGTPVAGGLELAQAFYLVKQIVLSGRKIVGFDLCEVGAKSEWDGNVAARILYKLSNWMGRSHQLV